MVPLQSDVVTGLCCDCAVTVLELCCDLCCDCAVADRVLIGALQSDVPDS